MSNNTCPRCVGESDKIPLYQCCRCFTIYCQNCSDTDNGRICPKCGMGPKLVLDNNKK